MSDDEEHGITRADRRRDVVRRGLEALMHSDPQLYYRPTAEVARAILENIARGEGLSAEEREAVRGLSVRDVEAILAFR